MLDLLRERRGTEIAGDLGIGIETIRTHIKALYRKLQVRNVAEAVSRAVRGGFVPGA